MFYSITFNEYRGGYSPDIITSEEFLLSTIKGDEFSAEIKTHQTIESAFEYMVDGVSKVFTIIENKPNKVSFSCTVYNRKCYCEFEDDVLYIGLCCDGFIPLSETIEIRIIVSKDDANKLFLNYLGDPLVMFN